MKSDFDKAFIEIEHGIVTKYPFTSQCGKYWEYCDWFAKYINANGSQYYKTYFKRCENIHSQFYLNISEIKIGDILEFVGKGKFGNKRKFGIVKSIKFNRVAIYVTSIWLKAEEIQRDIHSMIREEKIKKILNKN
ncbi:hypothetical protein [Cytophaga hutchinsonii]|uniref:Uncharacterized protein n=1 Tax=Cytophaga hutchinsonii (strain ATCC 33406 / DSM 1761 / CIP 103989 / NBRC 15051 / NCIMB 9469 / D465) TaxID=269798 RepID=A0A6N4SUW1_CYTH3|nr:hypothetical protein [Cytophaga hutchinsonii]ABG60193.1 hypothetical protein CHU_2951 [Cytophaga hutchinsonii ATCC 33406]SFX22264.1 hypothetical protein SAMN04487930_102110 [Cytophaga hutchinsonii ATCC 33406]